MEIERLIHNLDAEYVDVRINSGDSTSILVKDGKVDEVVENRLWGIGIRVLSNSSWGFASTNQPKNVEKAFRRALKLAKISKGNICVCKEKGKKGRSKTRVKIDPMDIDIMDKIEKIFKIEKGMKVNSKIKSTSVFYSDLSEEKIFMNSEGFEIVQEIKIIFLSMSAVGRMGNIIQGGSERIGGCKGYEILEGGEEKAIEVGEKAVRLLSAHLPPKGKFTVILDGRVGGVLAHEAVGHGCEADSILANNSILHNKIGACIASPLISIIDDPSIKGSFGSYEYDDEGIKGRKKFIVKNGVLTGFLHSRETAKKLGERPTGNSRASTYTHLPIVRMSNIYIESGESKTDELFEIPYGIYAKGMKGGAVQPKTGDFSFTAEEGYIIKNGERSTLLRDLTLSGNILHTLKSVDVVGNDFSEIHPGFCGKLGQRIPVGDGAPHLRVQNILIG